MIMQQMYTVNEKQAKIILKNNQIDSYRHDNAEEQSVRLFHQLKKKRISAILQIKLCNHLEQDKGKTMNDEAGSEEGKNRNGITRGKADIGFCSD